LHLRMKVLCFFGKLGTTHPTTGVMSHKTSIHLFYPRKKLALKARQYERHEMHTECKGLLKTDHFEDQDIFMKVVFFLFGGHPASEICTDVSEQCSETSAHKIQKTGDPPPQKKNRTFTTRPKFEIKNLYGNHTVVFITK
jgi:hypothetical protein